MRTAIIVIVAFVAGALTHKLVEYLRWRLSDDKTGIFVQLPDNEKCEKAKEAIEKALKEAFPEMNVDEVKK